MRLEVTEANYAAQVVKVGNLLKLEGADRLEGIPLFGMQALTAKGGVSVGGIGILFPTECQLSENYCKKNNLYSTQLLNEDTNQKGYISEKRRVRAIQLRKHNSNCLFMTMKSLQNIGIDTTSLKEGDVFNSIDGVEICKKYKIVNQRGQGEDKNKQRNQLRKCRIEPKLLPEHIDTDNWWRNEHKVAENADVIVTAKYHGCVHESTLIDTDKGTKTIKEIVDNKLNVKVKCFDVNKNEEVFCDIDQHYFKQDTCDWYEVELEDGSKITITGNNPVWLPELNCYRNTEDLSVGDILLKS